MIKKIDLILSALSGAMLVLAFPPFDYYPLAWVALMPLLIALLGKDFKSSFIIGLLAGFVYFGGTVYWVFNSMYYYGGIPAAISAILVIILSLYLASYVGIFSALFNYLSGYSKFPAVFLVPVIWVTLEVLRTYLFTGFPWSVLGYSQYKFLMLIQIADTTGVYGISFLVAALNGAIFDVVINWPRKLSRMPLFERWPLTVGLVIFGTMIIFTTAYGMVRLQTEEKGQKLTASVIQGNFEQGEKWDINYQRKIIDTYKRLTERASDYAPDLVIWPESAVPFIFGNDEHLTGEIVEFQKQLDSHLLFGSVLVKNVKDGKYQLSNSAVLMSPEGEVLSAYDKIHLVPYGEYVPLRRLFPFIGKLVTAIGDFVPGREYTVMEMPGAKIGTLICYETIFPGMVRKFAQKGAGLFVSITNDAWFGRSSAPYQHFSTAVFRAVENRLPVLRAANTGISGFIDAKGRIRIKSDIFVEAVLTDSVMLGSFKKSFYSKYGDLFAFFCIISCVLLLIEDIYSKKEKSF